MKIARFVSKSVLVGALIMAALNAEAIIKKPKAARAPAVEETQTALAQGEETPLATRLVVDSAPQDEAGMAIADTAAQAAANTTAATSIQVPPVTTAISEIKPDVAKLPENEIPVLTGAKDSKKSTGDGVSRILITLGVLTVVLGALIYGLKRWASRRSGKNQNTKIRVITQHALGPKKSLVIVQVAGESILVGVTDHNISMLKTLSLIDDEIPDELPRNFNTALDDYGDEETVRIGKGPNRERDDFAMRGLSEIRDTVSTRLRNMKNL